MAILVARAEAAFEQEVERMLAFARLEPDVVACDLHPHMHSTLFAEDRFGDRPLVRVQHHHAHMAAVMAEHGLGTDADVAAIVLDGVGFDPDGVVRGGEVLVGGYARHERHACLRPIALPGGDKAAREPHRVATSLLADAGLRDRAPAGCWDDDIAAILDVRAVSPRCSSAGRLFDGVAALLGLAPRVQGYEAHAAMLLEAAADPTEPGAYELPLRAGELDTRVLVRALLDDDADVRIRAARFHNGLADGLVRAAAAPGRETVALAGGCLLNRSLTTRLLAGLERAGLRVLRPMLLPAGDGAISAGQAVIAACRTGGS